MSLIAISAADPREPELRRLIEDLDRLQLSLYPAESNHLLDIDTLAGADIRFFAASMNGAIVGCGCIRLCGNYAEVKRVYVALGARGMGVARAIMARLEAEALAAGLSLARLETGIHQPEALGLYEALGYSRRHSFGDYSADDPNSVFMEKQLG